jgi:DNA-binding response OmpR family regulator
MTWVTHESCAKSLSPTGCYTEETLTDAGYDVVGPADRLEAALDLAANEALDGAVLDVNLDGVAVWPLATLLRKRGIPLPELRV